MAGTETVKRTTVATVLGPVAAEELGVVAVHEALLSVLPGAQYAYDITLDRAAIFEVLAARLADFRSAGGGTIVDSTGMFHGRDVPLLEALSRASGVHIVASTGMGPEAMLGGYFLTPQTNPPTPWPADRFADLFGAEISEGMVVPRVERRGGAGLVTTTVTAGGMTATDESLLRGAGRAALATGVPVSFRFGADAIGELAVLLDEQLPAARVLVGGLDRRDAVAAGAPAAVAAAGAYVGIDHVGAQTDDHLDDAARVALITELIDAGHVERILLSSNAVGYAAGHVAGELSYGHVLRSFVPLLREGGVAERDIAQIVSANPRDLLGVVDDGPAA